MRCMSFLNSKEEGSSKRVEEGERERKGGGERERELITHQFSCDLFVKAMTSSPVAVEKMRRLLC